MPGPANMGLPTSLHFGLTESHLNCSGRPARGIQLRPIRGCVMLPVMGDAVLRRLTLMLRLGESGAAVQADAGSALPSKKLRIALLTLAVFAALC